MENSPSQRISSVASEAAGASDARHRMNAPRAPIGRDRWRTSLTAVVAVLNLAAVVLTATNRDDCALAARAAAYCLMAIDDVLKRRDS